MKATGNVLSSVKSKYILNNEVETIVFLNNLDAMPNTGAWDASEAQDGSVMAWVIAGTEYIAGNGGVDANPECKEMFAECRNLREIRFNDSFYTGNMTDMSGMFRRSSFEAVDCRSLDMSNVTGMAGMFEDCVRLRWVNLNGCQIPKVTDMSKMFFCCCLLKGVDLDGVYAPSVTDMSEMFRYCNNLEYSNFEHFVAPKVEHMRAMFWQCSDLTSVRFGGYSSPEFDTSNVTEMDFLFADCYSLTELDLSSFNTSKVKSMPEMFKGCKALKTLDISSFDTSDHPNMHGMFEDCESLTKLLLGPNFCVKYYRRYMAPGASRKAKRELLKHQLFGK